MSPPHPPLSFRAPPHLSPIVVPFLFYQDNLKSGVVSFLFTNGGNTRGGRDRNLDVILWKKGLSCLHATQNEEGGQRRNRNRYD